jgi:hypothetical protein
MDALGKEGRRILNSGLADGLEGLTERPPAITALLQQLETMPAWVTPDMLGRGALAPVSVSPLIMLAGDERADKCSGLRAILPALEDLVLGCYQHWGPVPAPMR